MSERAKWFTALRKLIDDMAALSPDDDWYVTKLAADEALTVVNMIEPTPVLPPKMFSQDEDCIVLTWGAHSGPRHYATISEGQITMLHLGDGSYKVASTHQISDLDPKLLVSLLPSPHPMNVDGGYDGK